MHLRPLALLLAFVASTAAVSAADREVDAIPLFATQHYDPNNEHGRSLRTFFTGIGVAIAGQSTDLAQELRKKLEQEELRTYFPDRRERYQIAERIAQGMRSRYLSQGYNNRNVVLALRYATNEIIATVTERVLEKEGMKDSARAALWSRKILASYNRCASQTRNYKEAEKCGTVLEADLVRNLGLAMSHELPRQEFGAAYTKGRAEEYRACMKRAKNRTESVKDCAFTAVKNGARRYSHAKVMEAAKKELNPAAAEKLADSVLPDFNLCLDRARDREGFVKCGDQLLGRAGAELSAQAIRSDARVKAAVKDPKEIDRLSKAGREAFHRCFAENQKKGRRDSSGTLRTDNCENYVKMETVREVASAMILGRVDENLPGAPKEEIEGIRKDVSRTLDKCWDSHKTESQNAGCLRTAAMKLATLVARDRLGREIPKDLLDRDPKLQERLTDAFAACLNKRLPANLFSATNVDAYTNQCASEVLRSTALTVAEAKVREALGQIADQLPDESVMNTLVETFVKKGFAQCLGANPSAQKLDECSLRLQKNIASTLAQALLPFKVDEFFRHGGGIEAYGLNAEKRKEMLGAVIKDHKTCLRTTVKSNDSEVATQQVNDCFKGTIRDLALRLGPLEFERTAKTNGINTKDPAFEKLRGEFSTELGACMDEKKLREFSVTDYLGGLESCQARLAKNYTVRVAKNELSKTIRELVTDASAGGEREKIEKELFARFDRCMDEAKSSEAREACVTRLRQNATLLLAKSGVRSRALKELETTELPASLSEIEKKLDQCSEKPGALDQCTRTYVKESTATLGKLVLHKKLKEVLTDQFDTYAPHLRPLEERFENCVAAVDGAIDGAFLNKLDHCATKLGDNAVEFGMEVALGSFDSPATPATETVAKTSTLTHSPASVAKPEKEPTESELADMMARTFLCLNGQLGPDTENSLANVDPESVEAGLLKLISAYVSQDLKGARGRYEEALLSLQSDMAAAGGAEARQKLVEKLVQGGMADALLKSMLRKELEKAVDELPSGQKPPEGLKQALLDPARLEQALSPAVMEKLRPLLGNRVLVPVLAQGSSLHSSSVLKSLKEARRQAALEALSSPVFVSWADDPALKQLRDALK